VAPTPPGPPGEIDNSLASSGRPPQDDTAPYGAVEPIDGPTAPEGSPAAPAAASAPGAMGPPCRRGERVGPYEVRALIAEGGMGRVYRAAGPDGADVALKVLHFTEPTLARRFEREGAVLERLDHRNLVRLVARGTDAPSGRRWIALEYVPGKDLTTILARCAGQRLSVPEAVFVVERCGRALAAAHAAGVLHRDVKLSNVLVTREGEVKLADFGLALQSDVSSRLTARTHVMGTLPYLSPEVALDGEAWSPAGDVYALGCLLFRLLAGRAPFEGRSLPQLIEAHRHPPPDVGALCPEAPPALRRLVARLLARDPAERPTAAELPGELAALGLARESAVVARSWAAGRIGAGAFVADGPPPPIEEGPTERVRKPTVGRAPRGRPPAKRIGPYVVERVLGRGAMGEVFVGRHEEHGARHAVKVLAKWLVDDETAAARFEREMALLASVEAHPHVVRVHSAGRTADGRPFYAMELVEGRSLKDALKAGIDPEEALDVVEQVADALAFTHARGIVHRDLKPDNVMLAADGAARLTDFGLSRAAAQVADRLTRTGDMIGTPAYMAPEQVQPDREVGPWTDVYGLSALLYELLTGEIPYPGKAALEVYTKILEGEPPPPVRALRPEVDPRVEAVVMRGLAHPVEERYPDAGAFLEDLRRARGGDAGAPPARWTRPLLAGGAALVLAVLLALGGALLAGGDAGGPSPEDAAADAELAAAAERLRALTASGEAARAVAEGKTLLAQAPEGDGAAAVAAAVRDARRSEAARRFAADDAVGARAILDDDAARGLPEAPWIYAFTGDPGPGLALAGPEASAPERARLAAWAGDADAVAASLAEVEPAGRRAALAWELRAYLPGLEPLADPLPAADAWRPVAEGERALAEADLASAAVAFHAADPDLASEPARRVAALLGLARVHLARGDVDAAAERAAAAVRVADEAHVLDRVRALAWAALVARAGGAPFPGADAALARLAPGAPLRLAARGEPTAWWGAAAAARAAAAEGDPEGALALAEHAGGPAGAASFTAAELVLAASGRDGAPGLLLARGAELAALAAAGISPGAAARAEWLLESAARLRPGSPALAVARARAAGLRPRRRAAAVGFAEEAVTRAPGDPLPLVVLGDARYALAGDVLTGEPRAAVDGGDPPALTEALAAYRAAAAAGPVGAPLADRGRVGAAAVLVDLGRRRILAGQAALERPPSELAAARVEVEPLVAGVPVEDVAAARDRLGRALEGLGAHPPRATPADVAAAEAALARAASPRPSLAQLQALLLSTSLGDGGARRRAQAFVGLAGDLPARAVLRAREAERAAAFVDEARLLASARDLGPDLPHVLLAAAGTGLDGDAPPGLGTSGAALLDLARAVERAPEEVEFALALLARAEVDAGDVPDALLAGLDRAAADREAPPARRHLARALLLAGLAAKPELGGARRALGERAHAAATARLRLEPADAAGHLVRAHALLAWSGNSAGRADPRVRADLRHDLACAGAALPWASAVALARLRLEEERERVRDLVDALLAAGFLSNHRALYPEGAPNRGEVRAIFEERRDVQQFLDRLRLWEADWSMGLADDVLRVVGLERAALSLRLHVAADGHHDAAEDAFLAGLGGLPREAALPRAVARAAYRVRWAESAGADAAGRDAAWTEAIEAAREALRLAAPAGRPAGLSDLDLRAPGLRVGPADRPGEVAAQRATRPAEGELREQWLRLHRAGEAREQLARAVHARDGAAGPLLGRADLRDPWGRGPAILHSLQRGDEWAAEALLAAEGAGAEALLALERAIAFDRAEAPQTEYYWRIKWSVRWRDYPDAAGRERAWRAALALARRAGAVAEDPAVFEAVAGDVLLDLAVFAPGPGERARLLEAGAERCRAIEPDAFPRELESAATSWWRRVRADALAGDADALAGSLAAFEEALERSAWSVEWPIRFDPHLERLREDPAVDAAVREALGEDE